MMPSCHVTFMLPFNDSDNKEGYNSDFKNSFKPEVDNKLDLNKEILLFKDNNLDLDFKPKEGTSFINIEEYLTEIALIEPLELPSTKIPILAPNCPPLPSLKSRAIYNIRMRI